MQSVQYMWSQWKWESAVAGGVAGLTTVVALHPLDIVRTRFQGLLFLLLTPFTCLFLFFSFSMFFWVLLLSVHGLDASEGT